jgi:ATP-dependent exoDNAse (exonuclease V) beta subunit
MIAPVSDQLAADEQNRKRALELRSFIVEAPAGAGKTELLTQRYLKLLQTVDEPEEIIAITFTNKAMAEMRLRILESLTKAANQEPPSQAHKMSTYVLSQQALARAQQRNWQLIENPARLRIFTIDGLCAHLARQMPLMSRFGSQPKVAEDPQALYAQAAEQTLSLLETDEYSELVKAALRYVENNANQLIDLLVNMLEKRDQWLQHAQYEVSVEDLQQAFSHLIKLELQRAAAIFNVRFQHALMPLARFAASQLSADHPIQTLAEWHQPLTGNLEDLPAWLAVCQLLLTNDNKIRAKVDKNIGFPPEKKDEKANFTEFLETLAMDREVAAALVAMRGLPNVSNNQDSWQIITTLSKLLNLAVAQLWLVFQQAGEVDFVEIAHRATLALGDEQDEPTELALKLDYKIQHLLVDEFQDTSPSQIALLKKLTAGWQVDDRRTLFAVGDPMQSIYRFRKANVGLFIEVAKSGIGEVYLERLQLYRNNRSTPAIVDWINQTFTPIFPQHDEITQGAVHYRPFIATRKSIEDAGVTMHPVIKQVEESSEQAQIREAEAIVRIVKAEQQTNPQVNIAVLVRSKKHLAQLVSLLRREHPSILFQAVEIEALQGRQVVQDLLSLTHALHHRADRVHWLALLRAPWCGLTLHDLHMLAGHDHQHLIWSLMQDEQVVCRLSTDGQARLKHVREILVEAFANQGRMPVSRWVRGIWMMLNGAGCLWEPSDVLDVQDFFACMDRLDKTNQFSPERMATEISKLFAAPDQQGGNLQMMTIHKSKGLEFDTVILPGLGTSIGGNHGDNALVFWEEALIDHQHTLLAAPFLPKGMRDKAQVSPHQFLASREKVRDANESTRVLYVAATRAERKLHLVGIANLNAKQELSAIKNTYLDLLWHAVGSTFENAIGQPEPVTDQASLADFVPKLVRMRQLQLPALLESQHASKFAAPKSTLQTLDASSLDADVGTLAHRYMELIVKQGLENWPLSRISQSVPAMQHWLQQHGHAENVAAEAALQTERLLSTTLNSAAGQWVLKNRESTAAELALFTQAGDEIKKHVIDCTFIEDNIRWIIDYKSGKPQADINLAAEQYRAQLETYAALFEGQGVSVKCGILFMWVGELVELKCSWTAA